MTARKNLNCLFLDNLNEMAKLIIFLFTLISTGPTAFCQIKSKKLLSIQAHCNSIDSNSSIKSIKVPSDKIADSGISGPTHIIYRERDDTIYKIEVFAGHLRPNNTVYYFKDEQLICVRLIKYGRLSDYPSGTNALKPVSIKEYYFENNKMIGKVTVPKKSKENVEDDGLPILNDAKRYLRFVK